MINELFSSPVYTLKENDSIHDSLVIMKTNFVKRVVIIKDKKPVGIVTERDINAFLEQDKTSRTLGEIMLKEIMKKKYHNDIGRSTRSFFTMCNKNGCIQDWFNHSN